MKRTQPIPTGGLTSSINDASVSLVIPCRNEEKFIAHCVESILSNTYPKERMEILIVDGMSDDKTREIIKEYAKAYPFIRLLDNPRRSIPAALNIGIRNVKGQIVVRMDAHSTYDKNYIAKCVEYLRRYRADNVGGVWVTVPGSNTLVARSIALVLSHRFGVGNAYYRTGVKEVKYVDTVPFGCFRKDIFDRIGLYDEEMLRNEDDEFNNRLIKKGGKILLVPNIISYYHSRDSLKKLWRMGYQYGYFKPLVFIKAGKVSTFRQLVPPVFAAGLVLSCALSLMNKFFLIPFLMILVSYLFANLAFSFGLAVKNGIGVFLVAPVTFSTLHFSYAFGYLMGLLKFAVFRDHKKKKIYDVPLTR
jgi:cellulose synthase/poly-beta-1,6-N-acetylglucosamine synthase-like glycosyltransferase